ncbi:glycine-rich domain-containing protein [Actinokineospora sp.]|uniref:glycine-rich domain-containing protein n=1 Tax=Actinokineospora sp. TaxID=1872133 RepID=UPI004037A3A6
MISEIEPRTLIDETLFDRLVCRIVEDDGLGVEMATRVLEQSLVFLKACADNPGLALSPSKAVDVGWHTFVLHTFDYARFCDSVAGRFIHHNPIRTDDIRTGAALKRTMSALRATGFRVDEELWRVDSADCNQCHAGCYDSP